MMTTTSLRCVRLVSFSINEDGTRSVSSICESRNPVLIQDWIKHLVAEQVLGQDEPFEVRHIRED